MPGAPLSPDRRLAEAVARSRSIAALQARAGALDDAARLYRETFGDGAALLLADDNTWKAAGIRVAEVMQAAGIATRAHVLAGTPRIKPTGELGDELAAMIAPGETPVAIGAGVINDVVKYAAFRRDTRYMCVATAASMDGYTSAGAPLSVRGFKKTIQCRPAAVVLADLDVLAAAPREMIGWGYGDMAGKVPAGADWIVADALGIEAIDDVAWPLVQTDLRDWLGAPEAVARGERDAVAGLFTGLALVGLAMESHGSSRPASGADHQIAHLWEMEDLSHRGERVSHGACVAVGCVTMLRLYDWLLRQDLAARIDGAAVAARAPDMRAKSAEISRHFGNRAIAERAVAETRAKHLAPAAHRARLETLRADWPALRTRLAEHLMPAEAMATKLRGAGAPADAADIGLSGDRLRRSAAAARFLRSRYTILDLLDETGLLPEALDAALAPGGDA